MSRSKGTRFPDFLTTVSSRSCTRSKVVNRPVQSEQTRRRRMPNCPLSGRSLHLCLGTAAIGTAHGLTFRSLFRQSTRFCCAAPSNTQRQIPAARPAAQIGRKGGVALRAEMLPIRSRCAPAMRPRHSSMITCTPRARASAWIAATFAATLPPSPRRASLPRAAISKPSYPFR